MIILEHILPTTEEFINTLVDAGAEIFAIIAKPYSKDDKVIENLENNGHNIIISTYQNLEETDLLLELLQEANKKSEKDQRSIAVIDVGGYFSFAISQIQSGELTHVVGIVEDTTFGHNRYVNLLEEFGRAGPSKQVPFPILSVARSELKEIEARFVGRDAVQALDFFLRDLGISISGRNALVIGYGVIGKNVARALRNYDLNVYVYDHEDRMILRAFNDGFHIHKKGILLRHADIIFSATGSEAIHGRPAMNLEEIEDCKNGVILASVGSKDTEFEVSALDRVATKESLNSYLEKYTLPATKYVILANKGTAVNFALRSISREILDLVFSEILQGILTLLRRDVRLDSNVLNSSGPEIMNAISKEWLRNVNMESQA